MPSKKLELTITDIHPRDGYYKNKEVLSGRTFLADMVFSAVEVHGWYTLVGQFKEPNGTSLDLANDEEPIVIALAQYSL